MCIPAGNAQSETEALAGGTCAVGIRQRPGRPYYWSLKDTANSYRHTVAANAVIHSKKFTTT